MESNKVTDNEFVSEEEPMRNETLETTKELKEFINSLSEKEKKAYLIAKEQLGMSFDLKKSNGFLKFCKNKNS